MFKLYETPISPYVRKVKMVLHEKGLPYESQPVDLLGDENLRPEYLALNPFHRVPVLRDGDVVLFESTAINEYLEEKYPEPALLPRDPVRRAQARAWEEASDAYFGPCLGGLVRETFMNPAGPDPAALEQHKTQLAEYLTALDRQLNGKDYVVGTFSVADIALGIAISVLPMFGISLDPYPNVARWLPTIQARDSFKKAQPTPEFMAELMARVQARRGAR